MPDLLVAAIADRAGLVVLHQDKDFDLIAQVTDQPTERLSDRAFSRYTPVWPTARAVSLPLRTA